MESAKQKNLKPKSQEIFLLPIAIKSRINFNLYEFYDLRKIKEKDFILWEKEKKEFQVKAQDQLDTIF